MTNEEKGMGKGLLIGIFTGAAVGSMIALLYAPQSGKKLRREIKSKSEDFIDDADKYISSTKKKALHFINDVKKKSELLVADAEEMVNDLLDESEKILNDTKNKVENYINSGRSTLAKETETIKNLLKDEKEIQKSFK